MARGRGVSKFIAALLLIVLAVAAGTVIYAYVMGYLGGFGVPKSMSSVRASRYLKQTY